MRQTPDFEPAVHKIERGQIKSLFANVFSYNLCNLNAQMGKWVAGGFQFVHLNVSQSMIILIIQKFRSHFIQ